LDIDSQLSFKADEELVSGEFCENPAKLKDNAIITMAFLLTMVTKYGEDRIRVPMCGPAIAKVTNATTARRQFFVFMDLL
jgi:hypothetical protein